MAPEIFVGLGVNKVHPSSVRHSIHKFFNAAFFDIICCGISIFVRKIVSQEKIPFGEDTQGVRAVNSLDKVDNLR